MGIEPTRQLVTGPLVLKTRRPTRTLALPCLYNVCDVSTIVNVTKFSLGYSSFSQKISTDKLSGVCLLKRECSISFFPSASIVCNELVAVICFARRD